MFFLLKRVTFLPIKVLHGLCIWIPELSKFCLWAMREVRSEKLADGLLYEPVLYILSWLLCDCINTILWASLQEQCQNNGRLWKKWYEEASLYSYFTCTGFPGAQIISRSEIWIIRFICMERKNREHKSHHHWNFALHRELHKGIYKCIIRNGQARREMVCVIITSFKWSNTVWNRIQAYSSQVKVEVKN